MTQTIHHALTPDDALAMATIRSTMPSERLTFSPAIRDLFDQIMLHTPEAAGVTAEAGEVGGVRGWWLRPMSARPGAVVLYLHGGGYVVGSARASVPLAGQIAARSGVAVFSADYRLAPEHVFPAATDDALAAYRGLADLGFSAIAVAGDSAGGGLALSTVVRVAAEARAQRLPAPRGAVLLSPWTDLSTGSPSMQDRAAADPLLSRASLSNAAAQYLAGHDPQEAQVSPLFSDLSGLAPVLIHVGEDEVLLDDARRTGEAMAASRKATVHVWAGMTHVFPSSVGTLTAAEEALDDIGAFLNQQLS